MKRSKVLTDFNICRRNEIVKILTNGRAVGKNHFSRADIVKSDHD